MWRAHVLKPPSSCELGGECRYECTDNTTASSLVIVTLLDHFGFTAEGDDWRAKTEQQQHEAFDMLFCQTKVVLGDAIDAGGAADPTFWPIHPTLERLYQYKTFVHPLKTTFWPTGGQSKNDDDAIDHACDSIWYNSNCKSHHAYDKIAFSALTKDSSGNYARSLPTNKELLHSFSPANGGYAMPYVYEDFTWEHCELDGFRFPSVFDDDA